jgi:hypothetical protein
MCNLFNRHGALRSSALLIGLTVILASCGLEPYFALAEDWNYSFADGGRQFSSLQELATWVHDNMTYETDIKQFGSLEYWASPAQTLQTWLGDCDEYATVFMYFAYTRHLSTNPVLIEIESNGIGHYLVQVGDSYFDPTYGTWGALTALKGRVLFTLSYGKTMYIANNSHDAWGA